MRHLPDCSWRDGADADADGCSCAERIFLSSCSDEEAASFSTRNPAPGGPVEVSRTTWTRRRTA